MANLKITILHDVWEDGPPEPEPEPIKAPRKKAGKRAKKKKDPLHDREEIFEALTELGHTPSYYVLDGKNQSLLALPKCGADLIFLQSHRVLCRPRHHGQKHPAAYLEAAPDAPTPAAIPRLSSSRKTNPSQKRSSTSTRSRHPTSQHPTKAAPITRTTSSFHSS